MKKALFLLITLPWLIHSGMAQTCTQWRGEHNLGIYPDTGLLASWPEAGPELIWEFEGLGNGYGSPAITSDRLYIQGEIDSVGYLFAIDLNGKLIWKKAYGPEWMKTFPGARDCPTVVDDLIYVASGMGRLLCLNAKTGDIKWSADLVKEMGGILPMHGHSESPVVFGDRVFFVVGGEKHNVVALNRFSGEVVWSCPGLGERSAYNTPHIIELEKRKLLVTFSAYALMGIDIKTGKLLWTHVQDNLPVEKHKLGMGDTHSNTVYYEDGFIYYAAGDGNGGVKLQLSQDGTSIREVWRTPDFDDYMGGFVKFGNILYSGATAKKRFVAINAENGETLATLRLGSGNTIAADGMIYYYNQKGTVHLIQPNEGQPQVVSSFAITRGTKEHFSQPVIDNGKYYLRRGNSLMVFSIKQ